ncbi:MAG: alpha/beta hydrolase [Chloroflexota bacterium]
MDLLKKITKGMLWTAGALLALLIFTVGILFINTQGEYTVPGTVTSDPSLPSVEIDGRLFHAETFGNPNNPAVIVIHGGPGGDYGYLLNLHALEDEYFVVFYDQIGAGLSPRVPVDELTLQTAVDDLHRIVTHFGNGAPVRLIGHSWGGMLAAAYVGKYPGQVSQAILAEPGALDNAGLEAFLARQAAGQGLDYYRVLIPTIFESLRLSGPDPAAQNDYIFGKMTAHYVNSTASGYRCEDILVQPVIPDIAIPSSRFGAAAYQTLFGEEGDLTPIVANAPQYTGDILFMASECSLYSGERLQREHMRHFPQATLAVVPQAGHEMFSDNPEASLDLVRSFFREPAGLVHSGE